MILLAGALAIRNFWEGDSSAKEDGMATGSEAVSTSRTTRLLTPASEANIRSRRLEEIKDFNFFLSEFEKLELELSGRELDRKKIELLTEASKQLRGNDLLDLYKYLYCKAQPRYLDWAITKFSHFLIDGHRYDEGLELISCLDDNVLQAKICSTIGHLINPEDLPGFIEGLKTNSAKDKTLYTFALQNINHDPLGVVSQIFELSSNEVQPEMWSSLTSQIRGTPPYEALLELIYRNEDSPHSGALGQGVIESWVKSAPEAAARFVSVPLRNESVEGIRDVSEAWLAVDPSRAEVWIESLAPGKPKDLGLSVLSRNQLRANPETSLQTAVRIVESNLRRESINTVMNHWIKEDPEMAKEVYKELTGTPFRAAQSELPASDRLTPTK